ncbi:hypothetical protein ABNB59_20580 [Paenibacillus larvae]|uniref:Uncharacterized protein n=5 Tax=Paenibacillus larvae TaxID=1464 RepID=V9W302_9BACL|nr:hypothetical protein [Paenibacillus larvae]AHD04533.1 hypothetical protein ERIC2_c06940 [Paenibacillus larvae subsp. larvae DSM 25430]AQR79329.1 hypothetical protein BXP28_21025 [Paenibacillus larvae subsp. larvae]AQT85738.1 hypothetical protein B1222_17100 [Paenibacillus larvae subsp. pulvifaciens]AQZ47701.1 hypothetical protein B5S25_15085 [Paenibacillus larvae subsp. pulvifaciens]ARF69049.1 hypothetical protein B7C51_16395 [Paenibacillus larvae subsp. pulvifaciens]
MLKKNVKVYLAFVIFAVVGIALFWLLGFKEKPETRIIKHGEVPGEIIYTYSHPLNSPSKIVWTKDGSFIHEETINGIAIMYIQPDLQGNLWTPSTKNDKLYKLTSDYQVETSRTPGTTKNFKILNGDKVSSHSNLSNIDFNKLWYEGEKKSFQMKLEGFLREFAKDGDKLYIFADFIAKGTSVLYEVDIPSEKITNTVPLPEGVADDMVIYQDKVVLATKTSLTVVNRSDWKVSTVKLSYPDVRPVSLYTRDDHLYVTLRSDVDLSGLKIIKLDRNFNEVSKVDLGLVYSGDQYKDDKIYIYSGGNDPERGISGELSVYKLDTWERLGSLVLPSGPNNYNVSGFTVL